MPRNTDGWNLVEAYRVSQLHIGRGIGPSVANAWKYLDINNLGASFPRYSDALISEVQKGRVRSAALGVSFYDALRTADGVTGDYTQVMSAAVNSTQLRTAAAVMGPVTVKRALSNGASPDAAIALGIAQTTRAMSRYVMDGGRASLEATTRLDDKGNGWQRVSDGRPCHFCAMLVSRGAVYLSREKAQNTGDFHKYHNGCGCIAVPFFERTPAQTAQAIEYRALWNGTAKGFESSVARAKFRAAYDGKYPLPERPTPVITGGTGAKAVEVPSLPDAVEALVGPTPQATYLDKVEELRAQLPEDMSHFGMVETKTGVQALEEANNAAADWYQEKQAASRALAKVQKEHPDWESATPGSMGTDNFIMLRRSPEYVEWRARLDAAMMREKGAANRLEEAQAESDRLTVSVMNLKKNLAGAKESVSIWEDTVIADERALDDAAARGEVDLYDWEQQLERSKLELLKARVREQEFEDLLVSGGSKWKIDSVKKQLADGSGWYDAPGPAAQAHLRTVRDIGRVIDDEIESRIEALAGTVDAAKVEEVQAQIAATEKAYKAAVKKSEKDWENTWKSAYKKWSNWSLTLPDDEVALLRERWGKEPWLLRARVQELEHEMRDSGLSMSDWQAQFPREYGEWQWARSIENEQMVLVESPKGAYRTTAGLIKRLKKEKQMFEDELSRVLSNEAPRQGTAAYATALREKTLEVLSEVREMGGVQGRYVSVRSHRLMDESEYAVTAMRFAERAYPRTWLEANQARHAEVRLGVQDRGANYDGGARIMISRDSRGFKPVGDTESMFGVAQHELGHSMETAVPALQRAEWIYHEARSAKDTEREILLYETEKKADREYAYEDKWSSAYSGKGYGYGPQSYYEIFTTGAESLLSGSPYFERPVEKGGYDYDFRRFVVGCLSVLG